MYALLALSCFVMLGIDVTHVFKKSGREKMAATLVDNIFNFVNDSFF